MSSSDAPTTTRPERPFQFTLRQLLLAMGAVCVLAAAFYWLGPELGVFAVVPLISIACAVFSAMRGKSSEAFFALLIGGSLTALLLPAVQMPRGPSRRLTCSNNLRNITLALQHYESIYGSFPPAYIADAQGNPMHSWRVLLLPFLERVDLYSQYRFDEPWDSPNNSKLHGARVSWYSCPSDQTTPLNTSYVAVVGSETAWPGNTTTSFSDIKDCATNTILLVEVHNSGIHWMEPRDLDFSQMAMTMNAPPGKRISSAHSGGAHVAFVDGSVQFLENDTRPDLLRAALTRNGRENAGPHWKH